MRAAAPPKTYCLSISWLRTRHHQETSHLQLPSQMHEGYPQPRRGPRKKRRETNFAHTTLPALFRQCSKPSAVRSCKKIEMSAAAEKYESSSICRNCFTSSCPRVVVDTLAPFWSDSCGLLLKRLFCKSSSSGSSPGKAASDPPACAVSNHNWASNLGTQEEDSHHRCLQNPVLSVSPPAWSGSLAFENGMASLLPSFLPWPYRSSSFLSLRVPMQTGSHSKCLL